MSYHRSPNFGGHATVSNDSGAMPPPPLSVDEERADGLTKDTPVFHKTPTRRSCWTRLCCCFSICCCCCRPKSSHRKNSDDNAFDMTEPLNSAMEDDRTQQLNWSRVKKQMRLFFQLSLPYFKESVHARWLLLGMIILAVLNSGVSVMFSFIVKDFWNALSDKNVEEFYKVLAKYAIALSIGAPVVALYVYQRAQLAVHWREWMTARTFDLYSSNRVYYKLERLQVLKEKKLEGDRSLNTMMSERVDNPDQRITEDIRAFTSFSLQIGITFMTCFIDFCSFSTILWSISPRLFGTCMVYAFLGSIITVCLGKPLVSMNFMQLRREADFRYLLVRLRENAESIAFYAGEDIEGQAIEKRVERVMDNQRQINKTQRNLEFFTNAYIFMVQIVPIAVVAPLYFAGEIELGVISQGSGAFNHILSDLSILIHQFEELSAFSASIERLSDFYEAMRAVDTKRPSDAPLLQPLHAGAAGNATDDNETTTEAFKDAPLVDSGSKAHYDGDERFGQIDLKRWVPLEISSPSDDTVLIVDKLDLCTPDHRRVLIRNLSLNLKQGENLLIQGSSGAGKSSLTRAIAGLWSVGNGHIVRPADEDVYFLPQRPYCTIGSLKDQLLYPSLEYNIERSNRNANNMIVPRSHLLKQTMSDQDLLDILQQVDLLDVATRSGNGNAAQGLYAIQDWSNQLSLGEQQRLAFGRLLVNRPSLVILDEATSALDMANEQRMYNILKSMAQRRLSAVGLTYVSVGHRPSLKEFHSRLLTLSESTTYELTEIES